jgi:hypothetical protein
LAKRRPARTAEQVGTALVGTLFGVTAFLLLLLFAVQVLLGLYTTTIVTAAATDAADELTHAPNPSSPTAQQDVSSRAASRLGAYARRPGAFTLDWSGTDTDTVVVTVHARKLTLLPAAFGPSLGNRIDRTIRVRVERVR